MQESNNSTSRNIRLPNSKTTCIHIFMAWLALQQLCLVEYEDVSLKLSPSQYEEVSLKNSKWGRYIAPLDHDDVLPWGMKKYMPPLTTALKRI